MLLTAYWILSVWNCHKTKSRGYPNNKHFNKGCVHNLESKLTKEYNGLSTLKSHRLQRKLAYWEKLCGADQERLLSLIFRNRHREVSAGAARLSCLRSFQDALSRVGLADCWNSQSVSEDWFSRVRKSVSDAELEHQTEVLSEHSSLSLFSDCWSRITH